MHIPVNYSGDFRTVIIDKTRYLRINIANWTACVYHVDIHVLRNKYNMLITISWKVQIVLMYDSRPDSDTFSIILICENARLLFSTTPFC